MRRTILPLLLCLAITLCACGSPLTAVQEWMAAQDTAGPGAIPMMPYVQGSTQSVAPSGCFQAVSGVYVCEELPPADQLVVLNTQCAPAAPQDTLSLLTAALGVQALPQPIRTLRGRALTWQWYQLDSALQDQGLPELPDGGKYRVDLALATPEGGFCMVAMITLPADRQGHAAFFESLFSHALYNTAALPWPAPGESEGDDNG